MPGHRTGGRFPYHEFQYEPRHRKVQDRRRRPTPERIYARRRYVEPRAARGFLPWRIVKAMAWQLYVWYRI